VKIFYNGREIPEAYALFLEDNGQAHVVRGASGGQEGTPEEAWMRMEPGPSNVWLEKQTKVSQA
jgi:hypothetical protein